METKTNNEVQLIIDENVAELVIAKKLGAKKHGNVYIKNLMIAELPSILDSLEGAATKKSTILKKGFVYYLRDPVIAPLPREPCTCCGGTGWKAVNLSKK